MATGSERTQGKREVREHRQQATKAAFAVYFQPVLGGAEDDAGTERTLAPAFSTEAEIDRPRLTEQIIGSLNARHRQLNRELSLLRDRLDVDGGSHGIRRALCRLEQEIKDSRRTSARVPQKSDSDEFLAALQHEVNLMHVRRQELTACANRLLAELDSLAGQMLLLSPEVVRQAATAIE